MIDLNSMITIGTILTTIIGFFEWRIRTMYSQFKEKLNDANEVNKVVRENLQGDIARLEGKIDMLISLQIRRGLSTYHDDNK